MLPKIFLIKKQYLVYISGILWVLVSLMLINFARSWYETFEGSTHWIYTSIGMTLAVFKYFFVFSGMADKNLHRILSMNERAPFYKFFSFRTYLLILIMMTLGISFRKFGVPGQYMAVIDIAIGFGLFFSSIRYFRKYIKTTCSIN
ncbi:MAG: hypothetical protein QNK33_05365 [Bacteroidales bacterium]|nr:hypothetical protein [Bacteroidales bacterium]